MQKHILPILLLCAALSLHAQMPSNTTSVYFETDRSELSPEACKTLDALLSSALQAPDYQIVIEAYADDRGTLEYNRALAGRRAAAVQEYLAGKGLVVEKSTVTNWGERKSKDISEAGRQQSRRVDLLVDKFFLQDFNELQARFSANTEQRFNINNTEMQTIRAKKGAVVLVPSQAFEFEDGSPVNSPIALQIQEAYDPSEFLLHNLTTMSEGRILQTGGMIEITALSNGKPLRLAAGKELTVALPDRGNFDPNMELFYAQSLPDGAVDWKPAGKKFEKAQRKVRPELDIDPALGAQIAALPVQEVMLPKAPVFRSNLKQEPVMPQPPYRPRAPKRPEWQRAQTMFGMTGEGRMSRKVAKKAQEYYAEQMQRYKRDSLNYIRLDARYQRNMKAYALAQERYVRDTKEWETAVKTCLLAIEQYEQEMYVYYYARSLKAALKKRAGTIQQYETYSNLATAVDGDAEGQTKSMMYSNGLREDLNRMSKERASDIRISIFGSKLVDRNKHFQDLRMEVSMAFPDTVDRITRRILVGTGIVALSDSLRAALKEKTLLAAQSKMEKQMALNGYVASVSRLGWINCDRFYNDPAEKMQVKVQETEDATLYAVCQDIDAMLPFNPQGDRTYVANGLPKGKKISIVGFKIKNGSVEYARKDIKVGDALPAGLAYQPMPLRELKEELKKLNF